MKKFHTNQSHAARILTIGDGTKISVCRYRVLDTGDLQFFCPRCRKYKASDNFGLRKGKGGFKIKAVYCQSCSLRVHYAIRRQKGMPRRICRETKVLRGTMYLKCSVCENLLPYWEFTLKPGQGRQSYCRKCKAARDKKLRRERNSRPLVSFYDGFIRSNNGRFTNTASLAVNATVDAENVSVGCN